MARQQFYVASWINYDVGDPKTVPRADLEAAVRKAAKAANQRLLRLERAGATTGVYMSAMQDLGLDRKRFKERPQRICVFTVFFVSANKYDPGQETTSGENI